MSHELRPLPNIHPFGNDFVYQCRHCGCVFSEEGSNYTSMLNCAYEISLRKNDPELCKERPILV